MTAQATKTVRVMGYATGDRIGKVEIEASEWAEYEACEHGSYQWPDGVAEAGDVLTGDQIDEMGITSRTVIFLD